MDTRQLELFVAVAEELSFTRAARRVVAVQSTVSAGVAALERDVGTPLFLRSTRQVRLTPAGTELLPRARRILAEAAQMRSVGTQTRQGLRGRVRVGIITALPVDIPAVLGRFHADHPLVELSLGMSPRGSSGLVESVRRGRLDVAWVGVSADVIGGLHAVHVATLPFVLLVPSAHRLATGEGPVAMESLLDEPHIDMPPGFGNRMQVDRWLAERGLSRRVVAEIPDLAQIPGFVRAGLGIAVTLGGVTPELPGVVQRPLRPQLEWTLWLVAAAEGRTPAVEALLSTAGDAQAPVSQVQD